MKLSKEKINEIDNKKIFHDDAFASTFGKKPILLEGTTSSQNVFLHIETTRAASVEHLSKDKHFHEHLIKSGTTFSVKKIQYKERCEFAEEGSAPEVEIWLEDYRPKSPEVNTPSQTTGGSKENNSEKVKFSTSSYSWRRYVTHF